MCQRRPYLRNRQAAAPANRAKLFEHIKTFFGTLSKKSKNGFVSINGFWNYRKR